MNYGTGRGILLVGIGLAALLPAQPQRVGEKKPFQAQGSSSVAFSVKDKEETIEINNVAYEVTGNGIPGLPPDQRLVLREATRTKAVVDEIGMEASTTIQSWPLGVDLKQKPMYSLTVAGVEPRTMNNEVLTIARGLEEVEWWSVYRLGNGAHLFDTYTPLVQLSVGKDTQELRYIGLEVPEDDVLDPRLRAKTVAAVLTYASGERVIREALITCDKPELATLLRSFADATRKMGMVEHRLRTETTRTISIWMGSNYPSPPAEYTISIPVVKDDLDFAHAVAPAGLHIATWKR